MKQFLHLLAVTFIAWLVHVVLVTAYTKLFADSHSYVFHTVYALELTATFSLILGYYLHHIVQRPSLLLTLVTVIGYLIIVDTTLSLTVKSVRQTFDVWHFAVAYSLLAFTLTGFMTILRSNVQ